MKNNNDEIECIVDRYGSKYYILITNNSILSEIKDNSLWTSDLFSYKQVDDKAYYKNRLLHREDGPAIEFFNGYKEWYINGKKYTEKEFNRYIEKKKIKEDLSLNLIKRTNNKNKLKI